MSLGFVKKAVIMGGQSISGETRDQLFYMFFLACVAIVAGAIFLIIARKWALSRNATKLDGPALDIGSLKDMQEKGLLTPEEMRKVREAVVRQTLRKDEPEEGENQSPLKTSSNISGQTDQTENQTTHSMRQETPIPGASQGGQKPNPAGAAQKLDIDKMLERGLITKEEYDQMRKHFGSVK